MKKKSKPTPLESALLEADNLINGLRQKCYGHPSLDFQKTAEMASGAGFRIIGHDGQIRRLENYDIPIFMILVKIARMKNHPRHEHRDSIIDGAGYFGTLDLIHQREPKNEK